MIYLYSVGLLLSLFFIYSFIGYVTEVLSVFNTQHSVVFSRGYLIGPYLPIFGFGSIFMFSFLEPYKNDVVALFVLSVTVCCLLEYFTSLIMEKIFKLRWWDYSQKKFNVNGRVCLEYGVMFGFGGIIIVKVVHPLLLNCLLSLPSLFVIMFGFIVGIIMFIDFIIPTYTLFQLKIDFNVFVEKDSTIRIKREIMNSLQRYHFFHRRLFKAFPNILKNKTMLELFDFSEKSSKDNQE